MSKRAPNVPRVPRCTGGDPAAINYQLQKYLEILHKQVDKVDATKQQEYREMLEAIESSTPDGCWFDHIDYTKQLVTTLRNFFIKHNLNFYGGCNAAYYTTTQSLSIDDSSVNSTNNIQHDEAPRLSLSSRLDSQKLHFEFTGSAHRSKMLDHEPAR